MSRLTWSALSRRSVGGIGCKSLEHARSTACSQHARARTHTHTIPILRNTHTHAHTHDTNQGRLAFLAIVEWESVLAHVCVLFTCVPSHACLTPVLLSSPLPLAQASMFPSNLVVISRLHSQKEQKRLVLSSEP